MIFTPPSSPTRETYSPIEEADPKQPLMPWIEAYDPLKLADVLEGDANGIQKRPEGFFTPESSPVRESFPDNKQNGSNEELIPGIPSYSPPKQADICSSEGLYQPPAGCSCNENIVDCQSHHQEAADSTSLAPTTVVGQAFRVIRSGPLPGLNKYGDIPNRETRMKARRRCANRELRLNKPRQYAREMEVKKAARDEYLRAQRMAGLL
ncbi:hypothetical protein E8E14_007540 [Neopestalotiopsis sp. 37M]|nr:hypothetical protein E8E14_007540 [Neopestalotiopsis sp. 37M]